MKYTKGSWKLKPFLVESFKGSTEYWDLLAPGRLGPIAVINPAHNDGDPSEGQANANLIMAAPDLLEAAKMALKFITSLQIDGGEEEFRELSIAINKAEGNE